MSEIEFVNGLIVKSPSEKAPDFVKANMSIKVQDLMEWLGNRTDEWINIDVKEAKSGKWYAAVSTFKPKEGKEEKKPVPKKSAPIVEEDESDLPF